MKLVIAEKPSVAQSLAKVIGANKRQDGYLEGNGYLVSWCIGHLVELSAPERYDERYSKWRLEDLPILPERFLYEVSFSFMAAVILEPRKIKSYTVSTVSPSISHEVLGPDAMSSFSEC